MIKRCSLPLLLIKHDDASDFLVTNWQQSGSRAQRYVPLFIAIRPKENIKISKLLILLASNWDS